MNSFDFAAMVDVFQRLDEYIRGEPSLSKLRVVSGQLLMQARQIAGGDLDLEVIEEEPGLAQLPSRDSAERLIAIMGALPSLEPATEPPLLVAAYASLLGGLAGNITHLIYRDYPGVVPRRPI